MLKKDIANLEAARKQLSKHIDDRYKKLVKICSHTKIIKKIDPYSLQYDDNFKAHISTNHVCRICGKIVETTYS